MHYTLRDQITDRGYASGQVQGGLETTLTAFRPGLGTYGPFQTHVHGSLHIPLGLESTPYEALCCTRTDPIIEACNWDRSGMGASTPVRR